MSGGLEQAESPLLKDDRWCFACGEKNEFGLHLRFYQLASGEWAADYVPGKQVQGWEGVVHGGIVATLLDEVMAQAVHRSGIVAMTAELKIRLKKPVRVDQPVRVRGLVAERQARLITARGFLEDGRGTLLAEAEGKFIALTQ